MQTTERLFRLGISEHSRCLICDTEDETQEHLFLKCCYSAGVLHKIKIWLSWNNTSTSVPCLLRDIARNRVSRFKKQVYATSVAALVYHVWWTRNEALWNHKVTAASVVSHRIQLNVIDRYYCNYSKKRAQKDREWLREIALEVCK